MAPQSFQLVMRSGPNPGKAFPLSQNEITVGRDSTNEVVIADAEISRKHARLIQLPGGGYMIEDLGSTNGTFVNGQRLMGPHTLRPGELVLFGENISLVYEPVGYDADATMVAAPGAMPVPPVQAVQSFPEPPIIEPPPPPPQSFYNEPAVPEGPAVYNAPPPRRSGRTWILAGCGCLLVLCCFLALAGYLFDANNLYCTPPFNVIFDCP